jgi:hypothetical protein
LYTDKPAGDLLRGWLPVENLGQTDRQDQVYSCSATKKKYIFKSSHNREESSGKPLIPSHFGKTRVYVFYHPTIII